MCPLLCRTLTLGNTWCVVDGSLTEYRDLSLFLYGRFRPCFNYNKTRLEFNSFQIFHSIKYSIKINIKHNVLWQYVNVHLQIDFSLFNLRIYVVPEEKVKWSLFYCKYMIFFTSKMFAGFFPDIKKSKSKKSANWITFKSQLMSQKKKKSYMSFWFLHPKQGQKLTIRT